MSKQQVQHSLLLLLTAFIWGVSFVAQSVGMDDIGPLTFNCIRFLLGASVLLPCMQILNNRRKRVQGLRETGQKSIHSRNGRLDAERLHNIPLRNGRLQIRKQQADSNRTLALGGISCGVLLCLASNFQQMGLMYTSVGKAGFITAFYIVIVPVLGLLLKRKCGPGVWAGIALALAGLYFLCMTEGASVHPGDILVFLGAVLFSLHILVVDHFAGLVNSVKMSCIQFLVSGVLSGWGMFLFEEPQITRIAAAWQPVLYAGILSCGVAYTLQIVGQKGMNPTVASLILSLESVISVLAGAVLLGQRLSPREILGCVLMFGAIVLAQLPQKERETVRNEGKRKKTPDSWNISGSPAPECGGLDRMSG